MAENAPALPGLSPVCGKPVHLAFDGGRLTSDAGVLVLAEIERQLGLAERLARCIEDPRAPERVLHGLAEMIRFRALMIAAGYPDANDCDFLRADPAFKLAVGRLPESGADLCSQPTMCRLENLPGTTALKRMMAAMVALFCDSFAQVPRRIVLDIEPGSPRTLFVGWGRYRGPCPRPAAGVVPCPPRQPLLVADPCLRGRQRQSGRGHPAAGQDP
ncbi:MAG: transposase [Pseudomonadota bacterium]